MYKSILLFVVLSCYYYIQVDSHTVLTAINVDGKQYSQYQCARPHPNNQWDYPISQKDRPQGLTTNDMTCGWLPSASQPAKQKCPVQPGSTIGLQWHYDLDDPDDTYIIAPDHRGPCMVYMAKSDTGSGAVWFKIYEEGYNPSTKQFCVDRLIQNKGYMTFKLPTDITPGNYLLRGEIIALHEGFQLYGAQPYVGCFEVTMGGSGTVNPTNLVAIPGAYKATDAGINFDIYDNFKSYPIPGPAVYVSGSTPSTPTTPTTPTPTPTTPTPTTPTPTPPPTTPSTPPPPPPSTGKNTTTSNKQCYVAGTPYVEAKLGKGGRCGTKTKTRCPDGMCCSQYGYCGTSSDYCNKNQGDYRKYACSSIGSSAIPVNQFYANTDEEYNDLVASNAYSVGLSMIVVAFAALFI